MVSISSINAQVVVLLDARPSGVERPQPRWSNSTARIDVRIEEPAHGRAAAAARAAMQHQNRLPGPGADLFDIQRMGPAHLQTERVERLNRRVKGKSCSVHRAVHRRQRASPAFPRARPRPEASRVWKLAGSGRTRGPKSPQTTWRNSRIAQPLQRDRRSVSRSERVSSSHPMPPDRPQDSRRRALLRVARGRRGAN